MFQYQVCNSEDCPGPYEDFRAQQCAKRNSYYIHQNAKHSWVPHEPDDGEWALLPSHPDARILEHLLGSCLARQGLPGLGPPVKVEGQWGTERGIAVGKFATYVCAGLRIAYLRGPPSSHG